MAKTYTLNACEELMSRYIDADGYAITVEEGCLGLGTVVCFGENLKTAIIKEFYINPWSSGHTVRFYNKMPKKYEDMVDSVF